MPILCDLIRAQTMDGCPFEEDFALVAFAEASDAVEEGGFACAVWSDDADDGFVRDLKIHGVDRDQAAKALGHFLCSKYGCHDYLAMP